QADRENVNAAAHSLSNATVFRTAWRSERWRPEFLGHRRGRTAVRCFLLSWRRVKRVAEEEDRWHKSGIQSDGRSAREISAVVEGQHAPGWVRRVPGAV